MPIIAGRASAAYGAGFSRVVTAAYAGPFGSYDSLASTTVGATAVSSISFAGIPGGYKHLQIRTLIRTNRADTNDSAYITINGDTSANYATHRLSATGAAAGSFGYTAQVPSSGTSWIALATGGNATSNIFAASIIDILDYANTNKYKTLRSLSGNEDNSGTDNSRFWFMSNLWLNTSAITSITLTATGSFVTNSTFALYGVK
jgi:hypothetical protein